MKQMDFVLKGPNASYHNQTFLQQNSSSQKKTNKKTIFLCADMTGIIPEEEEEGQELYDDVGQMDEIYEVLPGLIRRILSDRFGRCFIDQF